MSIRSEFRQFITRGNVLDLAIGVIIGAAFGRVVNSVVNDILMPPIGMLLGQVDFSDLFIALDGGLYSSLQQAKERGAPTLNYGVFINTLIEFLIVGATIFLIMKLINRFYRRAETPDVEMRECPYCVSRIAVKARRCPQCTSEVQAVSAA